eukprot:gene26078-34686_t
MSLVYMDIQIGGQSPRRIVFRLYDTIVPKTAQNFKSLCIGDRGIGKVTQKPLQFKGSIFHRVIPGFMCQGGDFSNKNGTGGESIYGAKFADESFRVNHTKPGLLSMANAGPNTNGSQFFITFAATPHLNNKHVVFGEVVEGMDVLRSIEKVQVDGRDKPVFGQEVRVADCGVLGEKSDAKESQKNENFQKISAQLEEKHSSVRPDLDKEGKGKESKKDKAKKHKKHKKKKAAESKKKKSKKRKHKGSDSDSDSDSDSSSSSSSSSSSASSPSIAAKSVDARRSDDKKGNDNKIDAQPDLVEQKQSHVLSDSVVEQREVALSRSEEVATVKISRDGLTYRGRGQVKYKPAPGEIPEGEAASGFAGRRDRGYDTTDRERGRYHADHRENRGYESTEGGYSRHGRDGGPRFDQQHHYSRDRESAGGGGGERLRYQVKDRGDDWRDRDDARKRERDAGDSQPRRRTRTRGDGEKEDGEEAEEQEEEEEVNAAPLDKSLLLSRPLKTQRSDR